MAIEPVILHGTFPLVVEGPRVSKGGLGVLDAVNLVVMYAAGAGEPAGYQQFKKIAGFHSMWVDETDSEPDGLLNRLSVSCVGLAAPGEKRKRYLSAAGQQISVGPIEETVLMWSDDEKGEDPDSGDSTTPKRRIPKLDDDGEVKYKLIATPSGTADRWDVREAIVEVRDRYFAIAKPAENVSGTAMTPPSPPTPPPYVWAGYDEPMRFRHPHGWVLDSRNVETLFESGGVGLWAVEDVFCFYYASTPD